MTKFYLEEEKVSSADEEHPSPELLCHRAGTVFSICHQRDAARLFHLWRGNNDSNKIISLAWQTTEALHPDELLQLLSIAPDGPSTGSAPAGDRSAPARFGTGIAVGASCHLDIGSRWGIKAPGHLHLLPSQPLRSTTGHLEIQMSIPTSGWMKWRD